VVLIFGNLFILCVNKGGIDHWISDKNSIIKAGEE
jgi:hypothetical protein